MSLKKLIVGSALVAMLFIGVSTTSVKADALSDAMAALAQLEQQIAALTGATGGTSTGSCTFTRDLAEGMSGADVTCLQDYLKSSGHFPVTTTSTGFFGPTTKASVVAWQQKNNVSPTLGYFGAKSRAAYSVMGGVVPPITGGTFPAGCTSNVGFSVTTGMSCAGGTNLPAGCASTVGYSSTTGMKCDGSSTGGGSTGGPLTGGAGSVSSYKLVSGLTNEKVGEDEEDKEVAGLEIEADDGSDLEFTAVKLTFNEGTANSDFDNYATEVSVWFDGEEVARVDADKFNSDNNWIATISLDDGAVLGAGETGELVVAVSGINNLDSGDATETWTVDFTQVRFRDASGDSTSEDPATAARTFSFESFATAVNAELKIAVNADNVNDPHVIDVHASDDTNDVPVLSFSLEAEGDSDLTIDKLSASTTMTGTTNTDVDDLVKEITLWIEGEEIASGTAVEDADGASVGLVETYLFDDLNYTIAAGDKVEAEIRASFHSIADNLDAGDTIRVDITEAETDTTTMWDVDDETGERLVDADISGTATGGAHAVYDIGLNVDFVSASATTDGASAGFSGGDDTGKYRIVFDVTSFGDDIFLDADVTASTTANTISSLTTGDDGILWATTTNSTATTTVGSLPLTLFECVGSEGANSTAPDVTTAGALSYGVPQGETRRCTLSIDIGPAGADIQMGVRIRGINWDVDSGDSHASLYTFDLGEFMTNTISLLQS